MSSLTLLLITADPSLGKVDRSSLSQQTLMELFIDGMKHKKKLYYGHERSESDIRTWRGIELNSSGEVTKILWDLVQLNGSVDLRWIPSTVTDLSIAQNHFNGEASFESLPNSLQSMKMSSNKFSGSVDIECLPRGLERFDVACNTLSGTLDLDCLPRRLQLLRLQSNQFEGTLSLTNLPDTLEELSAHENAFSGTINVTSLPHCMIALFIHQNELSGDTDFNSLPDTLQWLNVSHNTGLRGRIPIKMSDIDRRYYEYDETEVRVDVSDD